MDRAFLEQLGLDVTEADGVVEANLTLQSGQTLNPLTRKIIDSVNFTVMGDRLLFVGPPEFVGASPINLAFLSPNTRLEDLVVQTLNDELLQLERRSTELTSMGISPRVDPATLQLTAEIERAPLKITIGCSRNGQFRIVRTLLDGVELTNGGNNVFELSEFFDRRALEEFLVAFYADILEHAEQQKGEDDAPPVVTGTELPPPADVTLSFKEIFLAFGDATLPPRSALEIVADIKVGDRRMRFAAARVQGRTFRGLLAGPSGKIWADRFELDQFPGLKRFIAMLLEVPPDEVEISA